MASVGRSFHGVHHLAQKLFGIAGLDGSNRPVGCHEERGRDGVDLILGCHRVVSLAQLVAGHVVGRHRLAPGCLVLVERDADELQALVLQLVVGGHQLRRVGAAGFAPRCPEVDQHIFARKRRQSHRLAVLVGQGEVGCSVAHADRLLCVGLGCLRVEIAYQHFGVFVVRLTAFESLHHSLNFVFVVDAHEVEEHEQADSIVLIVSHKLAHIALLVFADHAHLLRNLLHSERVALEECRLAFLLEFDGALMVGHLGGETEEPECQVGTFDLDVFEVFGIGHQLDVGVFDKQDYRRVAALDEQIHQFGIFDAAGEGEFAVNKVGGVIKTKGSTVDDVRKVVGTIPPAQMSADVKLLQDDLIQMSRDLAGAGDSATGDVDPESTSGRAIIAVQQAQKAPVTEQRDGCKDLIEDIALIWLDMLLVYAKDGIPMEEKVIDPTTSKETYQVVVVSPEVLKRVKATVKIDITPKSPFDKFALEQTLENLLTSGLLQVQRLPELKAYAEALPDDSVAPKMIILDIIDKALQEQRKIATINAQAQMMEQRADHFLTSDPDEQADEIAAAEQMVSQAVGNNNPDDN